MQEEFKQVILEIFYVGHGWKKQNKTKYRKHARSSVAILSALSIPSRRIGGNTSQKKRTYLMDQPRVSPESATTVRGGDVTYGTNVEPSNRCCSLRLPMRWSNRGEHKSLSKLLFPLEAFGGLSKVDPFAFAFVPFQPVTIQCAHVELIEVVGRGQRINGGDISPYCAPYASYVCKHVSDEWELGTGGEEGRMGGAALKDSV